MNSDGVYPDLVDLCKRSKKSARKFGLLQSQCLFRKDAVRSYQKISYKKAGRCPFVFDGDDFGLKAKWTAILKNKERSSDSRFFCPKNVVTRKAQTKSNKDERRFFGPTLEKIVYEFEPSGDGDHSLYREP